MASTFRPKTRSTIHEFDLIHALHKQHSRRTPSVIRGIGDDAAVITSQAGQWTVLTTDLLTEGVHFDLRTATMADIGFRAAAANLSDVAAMGGTPQYLLAALAIPRTGSSRQVEQLYRGMMAACRPHHVRLIGGDTSASSGGWFLSLTLIGMVPPTQGPLSERCTNRRLPLRNRHNRRCLGRFETLERTTGPCETPSAHSDTFGQAPAIFDRTAPASNRAHRGRPVAQHPSIRDLRDRYFRRPLRRPPPHLRRKPCRRGPRPRRAPSIAGLPRLCSISKARSGESRTDRRRGL